MGFTLGILGGGLQGLEAAFLARMEGWDTVVADARPAPPASRLAGRFVRTEVRTAGDLDRAFKGADFVLPCLEDLGTLDALFGKGAHSAPATPAHFDCDSFRLTRDKLLSKELFAECGIPCPLSPPEAGLPLVSKPADQSGSKGVRILRTTGELAEALASGAGGVIEEYCPGPSYSVEVTGRPGDYLSWPVTFLEMDGRFDCRRVTAPADLGPEDERGFRRHALAAAEALKLRGIMDMEIIMSP
ncbi:MAG: ATP-grasp domain-containing protein, partial [Deltaproteobacteria bacterium]|nr:ATP-grasp domain-containing protein [Deltaproteobacteria bacterium]